MQELQIRFSSRKGTILIWICSSCLFNNLGITFPFFLEVFGNRLYYLTVSLATQRPSIETYLFLTTIKLIVYNQFFSYTKYFSKISSKMVSNKTIYKLYVSSIDVRGFKIISLCHFKYCVRYRKLITYFLSFMIMTNHRKQIRYDETFSTECDLLVYLLCDFFTLKIFTFLSSSFGSPLLMSLLMIAYVIERFIRVSNYVILFNFLFVHVFNLDRISWCWIIKSTVNSKMPWINAAMLSIEF